MMNKQHTDKKKYFIGVDSDGTAFDSMKIKHMKAFLPEMIRLWKLEDAEDIVYKIGADINLYSETRGINRFAGLLLCFEELRNKSVSVPDFSDLYGFVNSGYSMSEAGLHNYISDNKSLFLEQVLLWSRNADRIFSECVKTLAPFNNVMKALETACDYADIGVISSASEKSLYEDWSRTGLMKYVSVLYGQEAGSKKEQLKQVICVGYESRYVLMIGDAPGDLSAAKASEAAFYPIIPEHEEESWAKLPSFLQMFFDGKWDNALQERLINDFEKSLKRRD